VSAVEDPPQALTFISYADFGQRFFQLAVTRPRVEHAVAGLSGRPVDVGPLAVGPLGLIKAQANGAVGTVQVTDRADDEVAFDVTVPAELAMIIEVGFDKNRFTAVVEVHLVVTARAADPLQIVLDVDPPTRRNVQVEVRADGLRASVLQVVAGVDRELKRTVAKYVRRELDKPAIRTARVIDVGKYLAEMSRNEG
jgi:hypothetical protein